MKKLLKKNIIISTLVEIRKILMPQHKRRLPFMMALIFLGGILDVIGLAAVLPVAAIVLEPARIHSGNTMQALFDFFGFDNDNKFLLFLLSILFLIFLIKNITAIFITYTQSRFSFSIASDISRRQFEFTMKHDLQFFNNHNSNILVRNIQIIPFIFSTYLLLPMLILFSEIVVLIIVVSAIAWYNITILSLIGLTLIPAFMLTYRFIKNRTQIYERERNRMNTELTKHAYQTIFGYIDVKLFNKENYFIGQFVKKQVKFNQVVRNAFTLNLVPSKIIEITAITGVIMMFLYSIMIPGAREVISVMLPIYIAAAYRIMPSMNRMLIALGSIKGYQYVFEILQASAAFKSAAGKTDVQDCLPFNKEIDINNVSYRFADSMRPALSNVSLQIAKGQKIGIIGKSGSGKTTLINVILRFLKEQEGSIKVDGKALRPEDDEAWRNIIGYVKQSVYIIDGDFYENIAFGVDRSQINMEKLNKAIALSKLTEVVEKSPKGLETNIGENGTKLSGGQRQRIAIARALYRDAQVLVFDEATSALDSQTEHEITESIEAISKENKTMIIIAHRITTLKNCDLILEMEDGVLINSHNYSELSKKALFVE